MARRKWGQLARASGGDIVRTEVRVDPKAVALLDRSMAEGLFAAAKIGAEKQLEAARSRFKTTRRFEDGAFAIGFDNGTQIGKSGPKKDRGAKTLLGAAEYPVDPGLVSYFGYAWFVARFFETGTVKHAPRPTVSQAQSKVPDIMPAELAKAARRRGFRRR